LSKYFIVQATALADFCSLLRKKSLFLPDPSLFFLLSNLFSLQQRFFSKADQAALTKNGFQLQKSGHFVNKVQTLRRMGVPHPAPFAQRMM